MSGPRQPSGPRAGSGSRTPGGARSASTGARPVTHTRLPARAALKPSTTAIARPHPEERPLEAAAGLSSWRLLLAELNRLLRDPRLTRALKALVADFKEGVRTLFGGAIDAVREAVQDVMRLLGLKRLRRILLALLALLMPLALLSLLGSSDDKRPTGSASGQPTRAATGLGGPSLGGIAMPNLRSAPDKVRPVSVALVLDRSYRPATLRRELRALGTWLSTNHAPGTRVSVIDVRSGRASGRLRPADLTRGQPTRPRANMNAAVRSAFGGQKGRRLLVTVGAAAAPAGTARTLRVVKRPAAGAESIAREPKTTRSRVTIADQRPNALAASVARAIMSISGQREQR